MAWLAYHFVLLKSSEKRLVRVGLARLSDPPFKTDFSIDEALVWAVSRQELDLIPALWAKGRLDAVNAGNSLIHF